MRANRAWFRQLWREQPGLYRGYLVDVVTAIAIGTALVLGGRQRTVAVAWRTLNENGGPTLWGVVFLTMAALLIAATFTAGRTMMFVLLLAAAPYGLLGTWFLVGALTEPSASFIGALLCFRAAYMHVSRAAAYWVGPAAWNR